jgi:DNA-binding beta-propeller fold protein YncE
MRPPILAFVLSIALMGTSLAARIELVAGSGTAEGDRPATECRLREPFGVEFAPDGSMWIAEMVTSNRLLRVGKDGVLKVVAANGKGYAGDGGPVGKAQFNGVHNLAVIPGGDLLLADTWNYRIRKVDATSGVISTIAGTGSKAFGGDGGPADKAAFGSIIQIAVDPHGKALLVADIDNRRVRQIDQATGVVKTIAGNGQKGVPADGAVATEAPLVDPRAAVGAADGVYILERGGHALRFVSRDGKIKTVVGTGKQGLSGDGGPGIQATMNGPKHLCMDRDGTVLIADAENHVIRRYDPRTGIVTRVAGTGRKGTAGLGGVPEAAELNRPHGVTIGPDGLLYITDAYNDRILKIVP